MAIWIILPFVQGKEQGGRRKRRARGKKLLKERKIAGLMFPIFTDRFSFPLHRSRLSDSAVPTCNSLSCLPFHISSSFPSGYKTNTNLLFFFIYTHSSIIHSVFQVYRCGGPSHIIVLSPNCSQK